MTPNLTWPPKETFSDKWAFFWPAFFLPKSRGIGVGLGGLVMVIESMRHQKR